MLVLQPVVRANISAKPPQFVRMRFSAHCIQGAEKGRGAVRRSWKGTDLLDCTRGISEGLCGHSRLVILFAQFNFPISSAT